MDSEQNDKEMILPVTRELVIALDAMIPEKCPDLNWTDREIWHYRGMRAVVHLLNHHLNRRNEVSHV